MMATTTPAAIPPIVADIAARAKIRSLSLVRGSCEVVDVKEGDVIDQLKMTLTGGGKKNDSPNTILCAFGLSVDALAKEPQGKVMARFHCDYVAQYEIPDADLYTSLTEEQVVLFAAYNTPFNAWPHAREFVQSMAGKMMLPPVVLPLFRPAEMIPSPDQWRKT